MFENLVGNKILVRGRELAVVEYNKTKKTLDLLVLKNVNPEEIEEGTRFTVTGDYLETIGYEIVS